MKNLLKCLVFYLIITFELQWKKMKIVNVNICMVGNAVFFLRTSRKLIFFDNTWLNKHNDYFNRKNSYHFTQNL